MRRAAFVFILPALILASSLAAVVATYSPTPYQDQWGTVALMRRVMAEGLTLDALFQQHNEHRIALPRLVFLADLFWMKGSNVLNLTVIWLTQIAGAALLVVAYLRGPRGLLPAAGLALGLALLFSLRQWENLFWGFQVQFVGVFVAGAWAIFLFARAAEDRERIAWPALAGAVALLVCATFNMANGLFAGLAMVLAGLVARRRPLVLGIAAAASAVLLAVYLNGYAPVAHHSPASLALSQPDRFIAYVGVYLGNIWFVGLPDRSMAVGLAGAVLTAAMAVVVWRSPRPDAARTAMLGIVLFIGMTAAVTGLGRLSFGVEQALAPRYATPTAWFWAAQALFWTATLQALAWRPGKRVAGAGVVGLTLLLLPLQAPAYWELTRTHTAVLTGASALLGRVDDPDALRPLYPELVFIATEAPHLSAHRLSLFAEAPPAAVGSRFALRLAPGRCLGAFDVLQPAPGSARAARAHGWAWDSTTGAPVRRVVLADASGEVVGLGLGGMSRFDVARALRRPTGERAGWTASLRRPQGEVRAYAVLRDGQACKVGRKALGS